MKKHLKPTAVPTIFPGLPSYLSQKSSCERSENATSFSRHAEASKRANEQAKQFLASDNVQNFAQLKQNFEKHLPSSENIFSLKKNSNVFVEEMVFNDDEPKILYGIQIEDSLKFQAFVNGALVSHRSTTHICQDGKIERFSDIANICAFLRSLANDQVKIKILQHWIVKDDTV